MNKVYYIAFIILYLDYFLRSILLLSFLSTIKPSQHKLEQLEVELYTLLELYQE